MISLEEKINKAKNYLDEQQTSLEKIDAEINKNTEESDDISRRQDQIQVEIKQVNKKRL